MQLVILKPLYLRNNYSASNRDEVLVKQNLLDLRVKGMTDELQVNSIIDVNSKPAGETPLSFYNSPCLNTMII